MAGSLRILVDEASKTAEARRFARAMATRMGLNETVAEQVSIVVTEACTNLLKHAGRGEIILHSSSEGLEATPCWMCWRSIKDRACETSSNPFGTATAPGARPGKGWARSSASRRIQISTPFPKKAPGYWLAGGLSLPSNSGQAGTRCELAP